MAATGMRDPSRGDSLSVEDSSDTSSSLASAQSSVRPRRWWKRILRLRVAPGRTHPNTIRTDDWNRRATTTNRQIHGRFLPPRMGLASASSVFSRSPGHVVVVESYSSFDDTTDESTTDTRSDTASETVWVGCCGILALRRTRSTPGRETARGSSS